MIYDNRFWFAPAYSLHKAIEWQKDRVNSGNPLSSEEKKAVKEIAAASIFLLGIIKLTGTQYRLQLVSPSERTPDIRSARVSDTIAPNGRPELDYQDLEIVTQDSHSDEELDDFIKRTKLSPYKAYQEDTIILCHIDKDVTGTMAWADVHKSLVAYSKSNVQVYLLARITPPPTHKYRLCMVYPRLENCIEFDVLEEAVEAAKQNVQGTEIAYIKKRVTGDIYPVGISPFDDEVPKPLGPSH